MKKALGMIELTSIARGITTSDYMLKAANVDLVRASTVCPGKYMVIIAGDVGETKAAMEEGLKYGGEYVVDSLLIPNISPQLIPAIAGTVEIVNDNAIGVLEFYSVAAAIKAADIAVKAAQVSLIEIRTGYAVGGKGFVTLVGDVGAVKAAVHTAASESELLLEKSVIPRPSKRLFQSLM